MIFKKFSSLICGVICLSTFLLAKQEITNNTQTQPTQIDQNAFLGLEITPTINYTPTQNKTQDLTHQNSIKLKSHPGFGARIGYMWDDFGLEVGAENYIAKYQTNTNSTQNTSDKTNIYRFFTNAIIPYHLQNTKTDLYVLGGLGYEKANNHETINRNGGFFHFGGGAKYRLSKNWGLRAELRDEMKFRGMDNRLILSLGLVYNEAKTPKTPPKPKEPPKIVPAPIIAKPLPKYCQDLTMVSIYFDFDKSDIKEKYFTQIEDLAQKINEDNSYFVYISGHTDNKGSAKYNEKLSKKRALAAQNLLIEYGVDKSRINPNWYGFFKQIAFENTKLARAQNRRSEIRIICEQNRAPGDEIKDLERRSGYLGKPFKKSEKFKNTKTNKKQIKRGQK